MHSRTYPQINWLLFRGLQGSPSIQRRSAYCPPCVGNDDTTLLFRRQEKVLPSPEPTPRIVQNSPCFLLEGYEPETALYPSETMKTGGYMEGIRVKFRRVNKNASMGLHETCIFPVQVFKIKDGVNYNEGDPNYDLFKLAIAVSAKRLYPNFMSLDAPYNLQYYKEGDYNSEVATMGCPHWPRAPASLACPSARRCCRWSRWHRRRPRHHGRAG